MERDTLDIARTDRSEIPLIRRNLRARLAFKAGRRPGIRALGLVLLILGGVAENAAGGTLNSRCIAVLREAWLALRLRWALIETRLVLMVEDMDLSKRGLLTAGWC